MFARRLTVLLLISAAISAAGCGKKIVVYQYPDFYTPQLKKIAVVPFRNASDNQQAGQVISDKLAAAMMANQTYRVFNRNDMQALMTEQDLQIAFGGDAAEAAEKFSKTGDVQAILTGTVQTYAATSRSEQRSEPQYIYDKNGNPVYVGNRVYTWTRNEANVSVTAALIKVPDGTTIHATAVPAQAMAPSEGSPPRMDPYACLSCAADATIAQLVEEFAIVRKQVRLGSKTLKTASEYYDGKWEYKNKFSVSDQTMFLVLQLPPACDRNKFRITIVPGESRNEVVSEEFSWSKQSQDKSFQYSPAEIASKGGGPGEYTIKFYSGPEPVLTQKFKITN